MIRIRKIRIFALLRDQVSHCPAVSIIYAVNILQPRIGRFLDRVRDLDPRFPFTVVIDSTKLVNTAEDRLGPGGDHPLTDTENIHRTALLQNRSDAVFIQAV